MRTVNTEIPWLNRAYVQTTSIRADLPNVAVAYPVSRQIRFTPWIPDTRSNESDDRVTRIHYRKETKIDNHRHITRNLVVSICKQHEKIT